MKKTLSILCLLCAFQVVEGQVIYYTNFNSWKAGWETVLQDTTKQNISRDSVIKSDFPTTPPPASGGFSIQFNLGPNNDTVALLSPFISTVGRSNITVGFGAWKDNWNVQQSPLRFSYSVDTGFTWIPIDNQVDTNLVEETWEFLQYDLGTAANNKPGIRFRFRYATSGNSDNKVFRIDDFIVGINYNLPIELQSFEAVAAPNRQAVDLQWVTASEQNNAYFEIERSSDNGRQYEAIGKIPGAGTSTLPHYYDFEDQPAPCGGTLYRLRQVDFDGSSSYSPVRAIRMPCAGFRIMPTIVTDILRVVAEEQELLAEHARWQVTGLTGAVLLEGYWPAEASGQLEIPVQNLPAGFYFFQLAERHSTTAWPFLKR